MRIKTNKKSPETVYLMSIDAPGKPSFPQLIQAELLLIVQREERLRERKGGSISSCFSWGMGRCSFHSMFRIQGKLVIIFCKFQ
jgi:hypothetical protein